MKYSVFNTGNQVAPLILRIVLSVVVFAHGAQKLPGWFGGAGFKGMMHYFTETAGLPWIIGFLTIVAEFFGPILLLAGLGVRLVAACLLVVFTGVILVDNIHFGFFMNWFNNQGGEGIEFSLLVLGICLSLLVSGGGKFSADRKFS